MIERTATMCDRADCDGTHYRTTRDDGRCPHGVMWGHATDVMGRHGVPLCERCEHDPRPLARGCAVCLEPVGPIGGHTDNGMRRTCPIPGGWAETTTILAR
jgi:hypothetical protein